MVISKRVQQMLEVCLALARIPVFIAWAAFVMALFTTGMVISVLYVIVSDAWAWFTNKP